MKKTILFFISISLSFLIPFTFHAQVAINTDGSNPDASSVLDLKSSDKGLLIPRLTEAEKEGITAPAHSMMIYQTDGAIGYYFNRGSSVAPQWIMMATTEDCGSRIPIDSIPFVIDNSGSYYLTAHMLQSTADNGITINTSNVSLDLNGYGLKGSPSFTANGIEIIGALENIDIKNGYIDEWKSFGISGNTTNHSTLTNLSISSNTLDGVYLGSGNIISHCSFTNNSFDGLDVVNDNVISNCTFYSNNSDGMEAEHNNTIQHCTASDNTRAGFKVNLGNTFDQCASRSNSQAGFEVQRDNRLSRCIASDNTLSGFDLGESSSVDDCQSSENNDNGFSFEGECFIRNSFATGNSQNGFSTSDDRSRIENNQSSSNSQKGFDITGTNNLIIKNGTVDNSGVAYSASPGNIVGPIITGANIATSYNANANIQF